MHQFENLVHRKLVWVCVARFPLSVQITRIGIGDPVQTTVYSCLAFIPDVVCIARVRDTHFTGSRSLVSHIVASYR